MHKHVRKLLRFAKRRDKQDIFSEIPFCIFGEYDKSINNLIIPPVLGDNCQPLEGLKTEIKDMPSYRLKTKIEICKKCVCNNECDGLLVNDISIFGIRGLKPILRK